MREIDRDRDWHGAITIDIYIDHWRRYCQRHNGSNDQRPKNQYLKLGFWTRDQGVAISQSQRFENFEIAYLQQYHYILLLYFDCLECSVPCRLFQNPNFISNNINNFWVGVFSARVTWVNPHLLTRPGNNDWKRLDNENHFNENCLPK